MNKKSEIRASTNEHQNVKATETAHLQQNPKQANAETMNPNCSQSTSSTNVGLAYPQFENPKSQNLDQPASQRKISSFFKAASKSAINSQKDAKAMDPEIEEGEFVAETPKQLQGIQQQQQTKDGGAQSKNPSHLPKNGKTLNNPPLENEFQINNKGNQTRPAKSYLAAPPEGLVMQTILGKWIELEMFL